MFDLIHANDKKNQRKHEKMERRRARGILAHGSTNTGQPEKSLLHPRCKWARKRGLVKVAA